MPLPYILARRPLGIIRPTSLILLVLNLALGSLIFAQGCLSVAVGDVRHIMLGIMFLFLGLLTVVVEFVHIAALRMYASFLFSFCGRGLFYLMVGCLSLDAGAAELGIGLALVIMATVYLALALKSSLSYDDPKDQYAAIIRDSQHGLYSGNAQNQSANMAAPKSTHTLNSFIPQGVSSSTFDISAPSLMPHTSNPGNMKSSGGGGGRVAAFSDKPPRI
ncbi:hypothetical protein H4R20_002036 [Coemansia guatemalensis]|uniref:COPI associated n=1 Tax=Coemansia guatemalensis TaxID=2761395 RepID=A0A9W8I267_9FUNG|nr:hypothetical protein H4R20_002036 [Coemansia guatemalensis]